MESNTLSCIILANNVEEFCEFFENDEDPHRAIVEILKVHKGKSDLIEHILSLKKTSKNSPKSLIMTLGEIYRSVIHTVSFFLQNTYYSSPEFACEFYRFDYLLRFKNELGYISDKFYLSNPEYPFALFTENHWKRIHFSDFGVKFDYANIARYNADRELSYRIYQHIYGTDEARYRYFREVSDFWKGEYYIKKFREEYPDISNISNLSYFLDREENAFEMLSKIYGKEKVINSIAKRNKKLFRKAINEDASVFTDESGYIKSEFIEVAADGLFADISRIKPEDAARYFNCSVDPVLKNNDKCTLRINAMLDFLINFADDFKNNNNFNYEKIYEAFTYDIVGQFVNRMDMIKLVKFVKIYKLDYEKIYEACKEEMVESEWCRQEYDHYDLFDFCEKDREVRELLSVVCK